MSPAAWWDGRDPGTFFRTVYYRGDDSLEGWVENAPMTLAERTAREATGAARILGLTRGDVVLDCPCGYGRHTTFLAGRGIHVVGVDLNPVFLRKATRTLRQGGIENGVIVQGDMRQLPFKAASFTAVMNLVLSFGFFSDEQNAQVLAEFARVLRPGGRLLVHTDVNPDRIRAGTYGDRPERTLRGGARLKVRESFDHDARRLKGSWEIIEKGGQGVAASYSVRVYEIQELASILQAAGLELEAVLGGLDPGQDRLESDSQEVVIAARKPTARIAPALRTAKACQREGGNSGA